MKTSPNFIRQWREEAFTMVEIAISIAVVAFAMVAIMGVLPTGMTVQRDNQEDTLLNQEGQYWLEAIRSGSRGLADLTNFVESITITNYNYPANNPLVALTNNLPGATLLPPDLVIGILSTPKYMGPLTNRFDTNRVSAIVKAITGPAAEKGKLTNEFSFRYMLEVAITPDESYGGWANLAGGDPTVQAKFHTMQNNLHDVRVILRWPVYERGNGYAVGNNRKIFRAKVSGVHAPDTNLVATIMGQTILPYYFRPNQYAQAQP